MAMELIETIEVGAGGAASIEFTSIPQDGVDLVLLVSNRSDGGNGVGYLQLNGDTGTNYDYLYFYGNASSVSYGSNTAQEAMYGFANNWSSTTASTFSSSYVYIHNYSSSYAKSVSLDGVAENNGTAGRVFVGDNKWSSTSAITSIQLTLPTDNFVQYSTASLYKISA